MTTYPAPTRPLPRTLSPAGAAHSAAPTRRRRSRRAWNVATVAVIWLTSLSVLALWVSGAGIQSLVALDAGTLTTLGRLTGLVSANLLLYQVLLMARVPLFERGFGRDGITRLHRTVGFWSIWLMLVHIVLLIAGYAAAAGVSLLDQAWAFLWQYPGMLLATVATVLLLAVAATSMRRARRALRYESWHLLHLYAYLGVGLAIPHMLWTGADFIGNAGASAYWWALWGVTAASVLVWRIAVPLLRSWRHAVRVERVERDGDRGITVRMTGRDLAALRAEPGQFFVWRFLDGPGWTRGHPFSLSADPAGGQLVVSARITGDGTRRMASLRPGTRVIIEGPYGTMTGDRRQGEKLLMFGAGAGVAPLVSLLEAEGYPPGGATLVTRDHAAGEALRGSAIARLTAERGVRHIALDGPRGAQGTTWLPATHAGWPPAEFLRMLAPDLEAYDIYLCGPAAWMKPLYADLRAAGVGPDRIHRESFTV